MNFALQPAVKWDMIMLASNGISNAIVETNQRVDSIGPGWINVMKNVPEIRNKFVEDQVHCPSIRPRVSVKRT